MKLSAFEGFLGDVSSTSLRTFEFLGYASNTILERIGHVCVVRALLTPGVDDCSFFNGLLIFPHQHDNWILTAISILMPVDPNFKITTLGLCLLADAVSEERRYSCLKGLLERGHRPYEHIQPDAPFSHTPLSICICQHSVSLVRLVLSHGAEISPAEMSRGWDVLCLATIRGDSDITQALLDAGFENLSSQEQTTSEDHILKHLVAPGLVSAAAAGHTTNLARVQAMRAERQVFLEW